MRRRGLLSIGVALLGGCLSTAQVGTPTDAATPEPLPPSGDGGVSPFDPGEPFATRTVGDPASDRRHRIVVWNDDADRRPISVRLRAVGADGAVVDAEPTFPAYGSLRVDVFRPADYVLRVGSARDRRRRLGVRRAFVDCADSATRVAVRPDGTVRAGVESTRRACKAETAVETDLESGSESDRP